MYAKYIKRLLDLILSALALFALSPLLAGIAAAIKLTSPGPVLFRQKRVGKDKTYFHILKFRTMYADTPKDMPTHLLQNAASHITKVGGFLRKTSLDELPQLINILAGQMSIVGPRPALWNQFDLLAARDKVEANRLVPGLTGHAQVHGRDELPIAEKAALDGWYAKHVSFCTDAAIILRTVGAVLGHEGIVEGEHGEKALADKTEDPAAHG